MRRMRMVALLVLVAFGLAPALPAQAGNWAVTLLDPLPDTFEADRAYTIGYWVLQHGSHPYEGELGKTGLRLVGPDQVLEFEGSALPEAAHYAVAVAVPAGTWRVHALQGPFEAFDVGTLTVPGGLVLKPSEIAANLEGYGHDGASPHWGAVHPPSGVTAGHEGHDGYAGAVQTARERAPRAAAAQPGLRDTAAAPEARTGVAIALLAACAVVALFASGLAARPLRWRLRR